MTKETKDKKILDSDADGLFDSEEEKLGTDPFDPDTDHDGLGDYIEVKVYHTDPLKADTDCDGIDDGHEVKLGRNPLGKGTLKDLFIPHKCNNYRPKALRPKRILFHAASAVAIKGIMALLLLAFPLSAYLTPNILYQQGQRIVSMTNATRSSLNLNVLENNLVLQDAATKKVEDMLVNEYFAHISPEKKGLKYFLTGENYNYRVAGENLALGFSESQEVYNAWLNSPTHYANIIDPDYEEIGVAMIAGRYKGYDTTLAAQYFGTLKSAKNTAVLKEDVVFPEETTEPKPNVLSEKEESVENTPVIVELEPVEELVEPILKPTEQATDTVEPADLPIAEAGNIDVPVIIEPELVEEDQLAVLGKELVLVKEENTQQETELSYVDNNTILYTEENREETYPTIDHEQTKISVHKPVNQESMIINVQAILSPDTVKATAKISNYSIELSRTSEENELWTGSKLINKKENIEDIFSPVTLASLTAENDSGNAVTEDINWENITPNKTTVLNQYIFARKYPSEFIQPLFDYTGAYFTFLMIFALIALLINIFVHIRKQHHDIILSTFSFIILLAFLVVI